MSERPDNSRQAEAQRVERENGPRLTTFLSSIRLSWRVQLGLILGGYALVLTEWLVVIHMRNAWAIAHPVEDNASGGMFAFSEAITDIFHAFLLMIPTVLLIRLMAKFETVYTAYSKFLFWFSVTAPVLLAVSFAGPLGKIFVNAAVIRLMASPFVFLAIGISRWIARFDLAKKLTFRALAIEGGALGISVVLLFTGVL